MIKINGDSHKQMIRMVSDFSKEAIKSISQWSKTINTLTKWFWIMWSIKLKNNVWVYLGDISGIEDFILLSIIHL